MIDRRSLAVAVVVLLAGATAFVALSDGGGAETATVTFTDAESGEELAVVQANVSDSWRERYTGLSDHESLGEDEGMLFVHPKEGEHGYVMRDMAFPIDMVFVAENGTITTIHHAELPPEGEESPTYEGYGKYVVELPYEYTTEHGIEVGDRVEIPEENRTTETDGATDAET